MLQKRVTTLTLVYTEGAIKLHRSKIRGFQTLGQTEKCHICFSSTSLPNLPVRENKHFKPGTTSGSALMNVGRPPVDDTVWMMTFGNKKKLYGNARTSDADDQAQLADKQPPRHEADSEPVNYWQMSEPLCQELLWRLNAKAVIDLTCCCDIMPVSCMELGAMYVGICFNDFHVDSLKHRLAASVFAKFRDEASSLYKPALAEVIDGLTAPLSSKSGPAPRPKNKGRRRTTTTTETEPQSDPGQGEPQPDAEDESGSEL